MKVKGIKTNLIFVSSVFVILLIIIVFAALGQCESADKSKADRILLEESSAFRLMLNDVVAEKSLFDNIKYAIDEEYYDERNMITYISVMAEVDAGSIKADHIQYYFEKLFTFIEKEGTVSLVQKDKNDLVLECGDADKMNALDYVFMGIINNKIIKASKGVYISQNDDVFQNVTYGTSNVKKSGCGPVALTMAINYMHDKNVVSLNDVLKWSEENDMYEQNAGTRWELIRSFPKTVSVNSQEIYIGSLEDFNIELAEGEVLMTSMGKGIFTNNGHFIVITEIKDEKISVLDSTSICRSLKMWDKKLIYEESHKTFWKLSL